MTPIKTPEETDGLYGKEFEQDLMKRSKKDLIDLYRRQILYSNNLYHSQFTLSGDVEEAAKEYANEVLPAGGVTSIVKIQQHFLSGAQWQAASTDKGCGMKWVEASERLPDHCKDVFAKDEKGVRYSARYTKGNELEVGFEDDDYTEKKYPHIEYNESKGEYYMRPGWYEVCEQVEGTYDEVFMPRKIVQWLDESESPAPEDGWIEKQDELWDQVLKEMIDAYYKNTGDTNCLKISDEVIELFKQLKSKYTIMPKTSI